MTVFAVVSHASIRAFTTAFILVWIGMSVPFFIIANRKKRWVARVHRLAHDSDNAATLSRAKKSRERVAPTTVLRQTWTLARCGRFRPAGVAVFDQLIIHEGFLEASYD